MGVGFTEGSLANTCSSPCGTTTTSPAAIWTARSPFTLAQHDPSANTWNIVRHWDPGVREGAIVHEAGDKTAQGEENSAVKNTAPDRRMTRRTSGRTSIVFSRLTLNGMNGFGASDKDCRFSDIVSTGMFEQSHSR